MKARIAIAAELSPLEAGGVETNLHSLIRGVSGTCQELEHHLISSSEFLPRWLEGSGAGLQGTVWPYPIGGGVEHPPRPGKGQVLLERWGLSRYPGPAQDFDEALKNAGISAIHFPYPSSFPTTLPMVYEPWDLQHRHLPSFFTAEEIERRERVYGGSCLRAKVVVTATQFTKRDVMRQFGVPSSRIAVIPRASAQFQRRLNVSEKVAARTKFGLPEHFLFYPAMTFSHKNHVRLFEALGILRDKHQITFPLICSGRPHKPNHSRVLDACRKAGVDGQTRFLGKVDDELMCALFATASLLVFPSLFEGLGLPILEAFHHRLPVVCANATCLPEVAADAAEFFDPNSAESIAEQIAVVLKNPDRQDEMRDAGNDRLQGYRWDRAARSFNTVYKIAAGKTLSPEEHSQASKLFV